MIKKTLCTLHVKGAYHTIVYVLCEYVCSDCEFGAIKNRNNSDAFNDEN